MIKTGFCNLKGGVGKTTACLNIAAELARKGKKVAVVDMDPQSNLSAGFGIATSPEDPQVFDLLSGGATWDDIVQNKEGVDIIPSSLNLVMAELNTEGTFGSDSSLREAVAKLDPDRYDHVLFDSPPQLGIFTRNVLAACDKIIVTMDGGFYSLFGLRLLDSSLEILSQRLKNKIEIAGILMTNYNPRLYIARKIFEEVKKNFGDILFENYITQSVKLVEASSMGMSIFKYAPKNKAAECYEKVTEEFLEKVEGIEIPKKVLETPVEIQEQEDEEQEQEIEITPKVEEIKPEVKIEVKEVQEVKPEVKPETKPEVKQAPEIQPKNSIPSVSGSYEEGIKQDIIDMLPDSEKELWKNMLAPITDISRGEIDVRELRDDFENSDKNRYTFYILNDEEDTLWPVMYQDQIIEPLRCVIKWDEHGAAEVFM